jgi:hypothetical protein
MVWGNLGYIFGCDYISYGLILLRFCVCVVIITASESAFRFQCLYMFWHFIRKQLYPVVSRTLPCRLFSLYFYFIGTRRQPVTPTRPLNLKKNKVTFDKVRVLREHSPCSDWLRAGLPTGRSLSPCREFSFPRIVQTGSEVHPTFYSMISA